MTSYCMNWWWSNLLTHLCVTRPERGYLWSPSIIVGHFQQMSFDLKDTKISKIVYLMTNTWVFKGGVPMRKNHDGTRQMLFASTSVPSSQSTSKWLCKTRVFITSNWLVDGLALLQVLLRPYVLWWPSKFRGRFRNAYELLNLRALKSSMLYKNHIFQCMGEIFCVEFQRVHLKFRTKYLTHTWKDVDFIHMWKFKSS